MSGECYLALIAWLTRDWRHTMLLTLSPFGLVLLYWPCLPESIRWLVSKGRIQGAQKTADRMAKLNSTEKVRTKVCLVEETQWLDSWTSVAIFRFHSCSFVRWMRKKLPPTVTEMWIGRCRTVPTSTSVHIFESNSGRA